MGSYVLRRRVLPLLVLVSASFIVFSNFLLGARGLHEDGELELRVDLPVALHRCTPAIVTFSAKRTLTYEERVHMMRHLAVELRCSRVGSNEILHKVLPAIPSHRSHHELRVLFYPDDGIRSCALKALSTATDVVWVRQAAEAEYIVNPFVDDGSRRFCNVCLGKFSLELLGCTEEEKAHIHQPLPMAYHFLLQDDSGTFLFHDLQHNLIRGDKKTLWVVAHPQVTLEYPPSLLLDLVFSAHLESENVIQNADVSWYFNESRQGYSVTFEAKDVGDFNLIVSLHWFHGSSEPPETPIPILVGSHFSFKNWPCDQRRSEIADSRILRFTVHKLHPDEPDLVTPPSGQQVQCTSMLEEGRWLHALSPEEACRPPFCTGDRSQAHITNSTWEFPIRGWLWVPYKCHYHYYNVSDINKCAKEKKIKWILMLGVPDSLVREYAAYLQSFNSETDTTKFLFTDRLIEGTDLRVSYHVWSDISNDEHLVDPVTAERSKDYIQAMLDQCNIREAGTSRTKVAGSMAWQVPEQSGRPDVVFLNDATAHCLIRQKSHLFRAWVRDFYNLTSEVVRQEGQEGVPKLFWYGNPFIRGCKRPKSIFITQARSALFNEIAKQELPGIRFVHAQHISQGRPESSFDGLHYLFGTDKGGWTGTVASTYVQAFLNELFEGCH